MPSTAKTHHLKLNQWSLEDKPQMEDFNQDNQLLEDSISAIGKEIADIHASLANKANNDEVQDVVESVAASHDSDSQAHPLIRAALDKKADKCGLDIYSVELTSAYEDNSKRTTYYKNQDGIVFVNIGVAAISGVINDNEAIGILPEGFRPKNRISVPAVYHYPFVVGLINVEVDGRILVRASLDAQKTCYGQVSYFAEQWGL